MSNKSNNSSPTPQRTCDNCHLGLGGYCPFRERSLAYRKTYCPLLERSYDTPDVNAEDDRHKIAHAFKIVIN